MNFKYIGLFIAVLILLGMLISCQMKSYLKSNFMNLAISTNTPPLKYNKISYTPNKQKIPCEIANQGNFQCSLIQTCEKSQTSLADQLSDSELAILYKEAYERAGLEIIKRTLENQKK